MNKHLVKLLVLLVLCLTGLQFLLGIFDINPQHNLVKSTKSSNFYATLAYKQSEKLSKKLASIAQKLSQLEEDDLSTL